MYNTITNNDDIQRGVQNFYQGLSYFYSTPSIINSSTVAEDRPLAELEALADNEMNFGKGVRRYDGTWASIDELDTDLFGDDMMRITYDENNRPQLGNYDLVKSLGWLANTDISLKDYIETSDEKTKKVYYDLLDGKTKKIIDQINDIQNNTVDVMDDPLRGRFTLMQDEDGNPYWQEVLVNGSNKQKLEAAGISLVHAYGSKKYSDGAITSGVRSFAKSVADFVPSIMHLAAGIEDLGEALVNGLSGDGFHSDYDALNKSADAVQEWLDESMIGRTSYLADSGVFNSWEGFISGLGQGAGSLVQFGVAGRAVGLGGKLLTRGAKNLSSKIANMNIGKLSESAATVRNTLSANALQTESLGAIAKRINKLIYESPQTVPMYAAGIALNYNEAYQSARDAGLSLEDAATIGVVTGVLNTILENKLGSNVLTRYLVGQKGAQQTAKALVNELGGDVSKLMNKQVSDQVARNVLNKITDGLKRIGDIPVLGSALEEGFEEAAQGFIKNSVESFYDSWIAPNNAEENKGLFGTSVLGRDEWTNMLEEGVIGSVLGGLGGFANTRRKEDTSIIPFIANGDAETVKAGAALAKQRGAITDEQYNGIIERVNVLDELRSTNTAVFADVMSVSPQEQLEYGKQAMQMLRDQHEYAASTPNLSTADAALNDNKEYRSIVSSSLNTTNSLSGLRAFAQQLEDNGKREQARAIRRRIQDSERDANKLFKDRKSSNPVQRLANTMAKNGYAKQVYELREEIDSMDTVASLLNRKLQELLSSDQNLTQISTVIAQMPSIAQSDSRIEALMQNYQKADTDENRQKIRNQIVGELAKQDKAIRANKSISQLTGSDQVIKVLDQLKQSSLLKRLSQVDLNVITSSDYKESFNEVITEIQNSIKDSEEVREGKKEAKNEATKKKEEESKAPTNDAMEQAYSEYRNRLSSEQEPSTERRKYIDDVVNGDETTQVNALESELASIVKQLNDMPAEQRRGQEGDVLKSEMNQLRRLISYLRTKYGITKTEADKNKRFKSGLGADEKVYHDADGNSYIIDNPSTEYSENDGLIYRIARIEDGQSREDATYQEYTENAQGDFLHSLIDENGEVFGVKMNQDKRLISLNARKMKKDIQINFEPVSEGEVGGKDTQKEVTTKANTYKNKLKCIPIGDAFKERLADPRTDQSKFTGTAVAYIWDKAPKEAVEAKRKFDRYKADGKKWSDLTQAEKDELLDYLPIQLELQHPYIKNKDGKLYTNTVAIPARKSATAQVYKMDEDQVQQRSNLIAALLNQGQFIIKEGDIQIQPGYFNTVTSTAPTTLVDEYGNEVQIANETHNGDLRDVESLGIVEENGIYYVTSGNQRQPLNIGIASDTENIYFTMDIDGELITRNADGTGSPGTPYLILPGFLNIGNKSANYPLKLNPRRIDRATATTVARLMQALAKGYADKSVILESSIMALPDVFGIKTQDRDLTVADVLEDIIYWGRRTLQNDPDPAYNKKYLLNKQLYIDFRRGQVRYGDKETILGDTEQDMSKFINWIMNNKSFSIDRAKIFKRAKMQYTYSIEGGYSSVAGRSYISHLLDNRIVTTNLKPKGSLYRGQFIRLKSITTTAPTNPVQQPRPVTPATKDEAPVTQSTELGVTKMVRKGNTYNGAIAVKQAIRVAPKGTVMQVKLQGDSIDIVDENGNKLGTLNDIQFNVEDGKINGKPVNLDVTILRPGGVGSVIASIIKEKFSNSVIDAGSVVELTIVPPTQPVTPANVPKTPVVEGNSRVDEVFKSTTEKLLLKFKTKPSKADIDGFLNSLVNKTTNIAKLYGFKDYAEARALLQAVGSNGKTLEQNLIEFMNNIGSQPPTSGPNRLEQITASVFKIPEKFTKGVTRLATAWSTSRISDKEKRRLHKILGRRANAIEWVDDFINVLDYVGNPAKAYGVTTRTATRIYTGAASGTGFHEAFHNVSLFALTIEQREQMYADARRIYSLQGKTNQEVEEFLANKFMEFALEMQENNRVTATSYKGLTGFFKRMWDWVLRQIGFRPSYQDINTLFRRIYDGQYSRVRTDKDSLVYFDNVYGKDAKVPLTINGVTLTMDSRTLDKLVSNLTEQLLYDNDITSLESVRKGIDMSAMKGVLQGLLESYSSIVSTSEDFNEIEQASKLVNIYRELVDNWDSVFRPLIENKLASYGIKRKQEDNTFTIDEDLNNLINDEVVSAWEINSKHNAKAEIRMLFLALPKTAQRDATTGLIQYENPDVVWYNVLSNVHNCTTFDDMMDRLLKLASDTNTITGIQNDINPYNTLYQILSNGDMTLQTQFFVTMKKHRNYFVNFTFEEDSNGLDINVSDADINKRSKQINTYWSKLFSQSNLSSAERKAELSSLQDKYQEISKAVESSDTTFEQDLRSVIELLAGINIIVDEATITNIINLPTYKSDSNKKSLSNFVQSNSFINVFNKKGKTLLNKVMGDRISVDQLASALSRESLSKTLAESYVRMNPSSEDDSVLGPEGNLVYSYSEHNSITQMFTEWLKDEDYVKQMLSDPYSGNSLWLNQLLDPNVRRKVGVKTMLALMNKDNYANSRGYLSISDKEDLIIKFQAVMSGYMPLPTLANKKSYYFISGLDNPQVKLVRDSEGNFQVSDRIVDIFAGYAQDEINAIKEAEYQISTFLIDEGLTIDQFNELSGDEQLQLIRNQGFVENYHYTNKGGKIVFNGNALKFRYFRELQNRLEKSDRQSFGDAILQVEEYTHTDEFRQDIRRYLNENINNTISLFIRNGIINTTPIRKSTADPKALHNNNSIAVQAIEGKSYNYLPMIEVKGKKVMLDTNSSIAQAIAQYAVNTAISTLEFEKILSGDLAFYKSKSIRDALDDRTKRFSALTSTRQAMNNAVESTDDIEIDFDTRHYNSAILATNKLQLKDTYDMLYEKYVGTLEQPGLLFNRFIDFAEREVEGYSGKSREELYELAKQDAERRLSGYLSNDPTDAQVWITPMMFRKLAIMNGEWSSAKENAYKLLMSGEPLTLDQEVEAYSLVMQPLKYVHYGFRITPYGVKVPTYDKMSLSTLFPSVIRGTRLQPLYNEMVDKGVDMVKMDSAVKSGNTPKTTYLDSEGNVKENFLVEINEQDFRYIGKQLVTDPHEVEKTTLLTQFVKIAVSNLEPDGDYILDGRTVKGSEIRQQYNDAIVNLSNRGVERLKEKFGYKDGKIDKRKLIELLHKAGLQTNVPQNLLDALKYSEADGDYYIELSALPSLSWIQSRLVSMFGKEAIDIEIPGNAFYQTTSFGIDSTNAYRKLVGNNTTRRYNDKLRFRNENGRMEVKLSINLFRGAIPSRYKTFEEQRAYILANKELFGFAYRVPTQGMNSTLPIEIVDVLPSTSGDVIFLPLEITTLTGSDFD